MRIASLTLLTVEICGILGLLSWIVIAAENDSGNKEFLIAQGQHDQIRYVNSFNRLSTSGDLRVRYKNSTDHGDHTFEFDDVPHYFLDLDDATVQTEIQHRIEFDRWSDRVILEKLYFNLIWAKSGFPDRYSDDAKKKHGKSSEDPKPIESAEGWDIFMRADDYCHWTGISCTKGKVTTIRLSNYALKGTLIHELHFLQDLETLDLNGNYIRGSIPGMLGRLTNLKYLNLENNRFGGSFPASLASLSKLKNLRISGNRFTGSLPAFKSIQATDLMLADLSNNNFTGTIPSSYGTERPKLTGLFLSNNKLTGTLPQNVSGLEMLQVFDGGNNRLSGTIPVSWMSLSSLQTFSVPRNQLSGTIPTELLQLSNLTRLALSENMFQGTIPRGDKVPEIVTASEDPISQYHGRWANLTALSVVMLSSNQLSGFLPPEFLAGSTSTLHTLDIGNNALTGSLPSVIGKLKGLKIFYGQRNFFIGTLPSQMNRMDPSLDLNLTGNLLVGTVPKLFCGGGAMSQNILYRQFGCDAILCPAGTFHPYGAATMQAGCRPCPQSEDDDSLVPLNKVLGRLDCPGVAGVHGDLDGNGILTEREILRLLWSYNIGMNWGAQFQSWADPRIDVCDLYGIVCANGHVIRIDLTEAALCSNGDRKQGPVEDCVGLPAELSLLSHLEVLNLHRRQFLQGTIPTEFGRLTALRYLDLGNCHNLVGTIPTELGRMVDMTFLNLGGCRFHGSIPETLYRMTNLEKFHLSNNLFSGTLSSNVQRMTDLKELMISRTQLTGSIPAQIGLLTRLENLEMYGNHLIGTIPSSLGGCVSLKRIDLFNNQLTGSIPNTLASLTSLQILHLKQNLLTGTIPPAFGKLPFISWFDVSSNKLYGTAPSTFGASASIKDFRLGGNMIYDPVPEVLCRNTNINGGLTRLYGCDGVICPLGTYSDPGHATHSEGCKPCPEGTTTLYLGSSSCREFTDADILEIFYSVMGGSSWNAMQEGHWKNPKGDVCGWNGIRCDEEGEISSIRFPLLGLDVPDAA